ncbi:putative charged multivesicular body protein 4B-like protein CHMP4BP1 [Notothenia coriiceps]|uniref:Charged multivesicular body protein 4B-like protein CHMP4BP1 n=1 Tax=Notothenia coriiceps TaxID=8208 RepID=A0A6I9N2U0_9TELE|nr:PREDICTED: putative charged multivesicular body protein 4B-like protein CHMP4BP1 [Notothenia coriiceps]
MSDKPKRNTTKEESQVNKPRIPQPAANLLRGSDCGQVGPDDGERQRDKSFQLYALCYYSLSLAALQALKRKKRYEQQLGQIDGTLSTIEFQREALENANTNTEVLKNMGYAAKAMKAAHENMDIDKVDDLMADITEQQEVAQEISDVISRPIGFGDEFDEDELMAELDELEQEELDKNLLEIQGTEDVPLPSVPSTSLPSRPDKKKVEEDEDDMADLEAWAAN